MSRHHDRDHRHATFQVLEEGDRVDLVCVQPPARKRPKGARKYVIELLGVSAQAMFDDIKRRVRGANHYLEYFGDRAGRLYVYATDLTYQVMESLSLRVAAA